MSAERGGLTAEYAEGYYCDRCGDLTHEPGACPGENLALGRCACPTLGYEGGVPPWMSSPPAHTDACTSWRSGGPDRHCICDPSSDKFCGQCQDRALSNPPGTPTHEAPQ